jgi:5'-3' exonuclease
MTNYILIDASYFIFYRVFALHVWWKNAHPHEELVNPYENEEFVEKFKNTFKSKIEEIKKKLKIKDAKIIIGKDCPQHQIWRMALHPSYKGGRNKEKNKEANVSSFFNLVYKEQLFEQAGVDIIVQLDKLEADDCLALTARHLYNKYEDAQIYIITSDHDYIQLSNDRIHLYNLKFKSLLESKAYTGEPKRDLFYKIILGDKSDNIPGVFDKCGKKTVEKCFEDPKFFETKLNKENKNLDYQRNLQLINFDYIPSILVEIFYNDILTTL